MRASGFIVEAGVTMMVDTVRSLALSPKFQSLNETFCRRDILKPLWNHCIALVGRTEVLLGLFLGFAFGFFGSKFLEMLFEVS